MRRVEVPPRPNSIKLLKSQGLVYADMPGLTKDQPYWPDDRYYSFTSEEIELIEEAGKDVFGMCCEAAEYLVQNPDVIVNRMAIPAFALQQIKESWHRDPSWGSVYGRFDFSFGGLDHPDPQLRLPKFYEFNADTPTSLVEAACAQWHWLEQTGQGQDQFNSIAERLVEAWKRNLDLIQKKIGHPVKVHFAIGMGDDSGEEVMNLALLMDTCQQAGWLTKSLFMEQIQMHPDGRFHDHEGEHIDVLFKLYPYEFLAEEAAAEAVFKDMNRVGLRDANGKYIGGTVWIEPPYKMLWSNKALFAILWQLFKDDPRSKWLLPTYFESEKPESLTKYARKPIFSREGKGITLVDDGNVLVDASTSEFGKEGFIVQELSVPAKFEDGKGNNMYAVPGLWFVDGESAGMGIREDSGPITSNSSVFTPHSISDGPLQYTPSKVPTLDEIDASLSIYKSLSDGGHTGLPTDIHNLIYHSDFAPDQVVVVETVT
ncbi:glutathionylspermidine synthase [Pochonia chlamydosporia 170]|uniref:Glutathionylspermidine synthase n=1 Tax=Pochonia chlamydosporia 170 TaxID=1380566 RepID=A0A179G6W2_METCM|nr:glutathionylspermidine synthase [Pochonia chlamydosporia 170]OAQ73153.1 glutathionylspermidine synthase [Pochonia chlamydosporia 170]